MKRATRGHRPRFPEPRTAVPAFRGRRDARTADGAPPAAVALPGDGRHGGRAPHRHAEPGDDRRAQRSVVDRRLHAGAAAPLRSLARADRLPLRPSSLGARLAAHPLHLVRHAPPVRRLRHHAVRAPHSVGRHDRPALDRPGGGRPRISPRRRRVAHGADDRPCARDRSCAGARPAARRRASLRDAASRHGGQRRRVRPSPCAISPRSGSFRWCRARR